MVKKICETWTWIQRISFSIGREKSVTPFHSIVMVGTKIHRWEQTFYVPLGVPLEFQKECFSKA